MKKTNGRDDSMSAEAALHWEIRLWEVLGWCVSFVPFLCVLAAKREVYFHGYTGVRVTAGVLIVLVVSLLIALKKAKLPGPVVTLWAAVAVVWLLIPLLEDILLLLLLLAVGVTVDGIVCKTRIRSLRHRLERVERRNDMRASEKGDGHDIG